MSKYLRDLTKAVKAEASEHDCELVEVVLKKRGHVMFVLGRGEVTRKLFHGSSTSCCNARRHFLAEVRKTCRKINLINFSKIP